VGVLVRGAALAQDAPPEVEPAEGETRPPVEIEPVEPVEPVDAMPADPMAEDADITPEVQEQWEPASGIGTAVFIGGGAGNFVDDDITGVTSASGNWNLRLSVATRRPLGFEVAYVGGANGLGLAGFDGEESDSTLYNNGLEGNLRFGAPFTVGAGNWMLQPFGFVGAGWSYYNISEDEDIALDVGDDSDNVFVVPLGAGFASGYRGFIFDARFAYRPTFDEDLFDGNTDLDSWNVSLNLGGEF
jgi:hypothetical protein